ncbi:MAG: hypothetical protein JWO58_2367 [Chitinophagaceae bacterium]|nr:hypothetical protein [Chitinophagaceae bacterium]
MMRSIIAPFFLAISMLVAIPFSIFSVLFSLVAIYAHSLFTSKNKSHNINTQKIDLSLLRNADAA